MNKKVYGVLEYDVDNQCVMLMSRDEHEDILMISRSEADKVDWLSNMLVKYEQEEVKYESLTNWRLYGELDEEHLTVTKRWKLIV